MSSIYYSTTNIYFEEFSRLYDHLQQSGNETIGLLHGMVMRIEFKYNISWGDIDKINKLLFVTAIIDLRNKLDIIEF